MTKVLSTIPLIGFSNQLFCQQNGMTGSRLGSNSFSFICVSGIYNNYSLLNSNRHNELIKNLLNINK
jgi:hypothetical protein